MVLWVILALLTGAAVLAALWPLSRTVLPEAAGAPDDVRFYEDQLVEIERERERGLIAGSDAESARTEAGRRLLRASATSPRSLDSTSEPALRRRRAASALVLSVVPIVGLALYGGLGSPHLPAQPIEARLQRGGPTSEVATALARIEEHLAKNPNDLRGWDIVAPIFLRSGRFADAARAYAAGRRLGGDTLDRVLGHGEALVSAAEGVVGPQEVALFERALAIDPSSPAARYYVALGAEQAGASARASGLYRDLLAGAPADAPWIPLVRARLAALSDTADAPAGSGASGPSAAPLPKGSVTPEIAAMVSGLDERLRAGGGTEAEWSRLVRSFVVLGRRDEALDRLGRARSAMADDASAIARLDRLAAENGLASGIAGR